MTTMPHVYHMHSGPRFYSVAHTTFPQKLLLSQTLRAAPPTTPGVTLSCPRRHLLLVTLGRAHSRTPSRHDYQLDSLWRWFEAEPSLWCAVVAAAPGTTRQDGSSASGGAECIWLGGKPVVAAAGDVIRLLYDGRGITVAVRQGRDVGRAAIQEAMRHAEEAVGSRRGSKL